MKYKEQGIASTTYLIAILTLCIFVMGGVGYFTFNSMAKTIKTQGEKIGQLNELNTELNNKVTSLTSANKGLNKQIETLVKINSDLDGIRTEQAHQLTDLNSKYQTLARTAPRILQDKDVAKQTPAEAKNSELRIKMIWSIFNLPDDDVQKALLENTETSVTSPAWPGAQTKPNTSAPISTSKEPAL